MNVKSVEKLEKSQVAVTVEVTAEEFEAAVQKAYLKMRNKISVPGFRPGKAPRKMIEKLYGEGVFYSDAVDAALPDAYTQAIGSSGLDVVGYPEVEIVDDQIGKDGFTFKATVAVYPEVELGQYKGVSAVKEEVKVTADDVKERLNQMAEREARLVSVDRKVKKGDTAVIDFEGFDNGVAFEGGKGENHELEIGSGSFVPGFEDQIIGMKAGEEKDIDITFPENYTKDLAGKQVVFHVKVNEVKEKQTPALDDEFAKDVSEFETLKELKDDTKAKITAEREQSAKIAFENALLEKVAGDIKADIPEVMIEEQCRRFLDEFKQRLQAQGIPYESLTKDFSKTNYSSMRAALNEAWKVYNFYRQWLARDYCQPIYEMVLEEAFLRGELELPPGAPDFYEARELWCNADWIGPARGFIDPVKEVSATVLALENRLMTYGEAWAQRGGDFEEGMETLLLEAGLLNRVRAALPGRAAASEAAAATPGRVGQAATPTGDEPEQGEEENADG